MQRWGYDSDSMVLAVANENGFIPVDEDTVRPGQSGYSVSQEAEEIKAAAIIVGLRYRSNVPQYDKMLQTILGERPCRVIVVSEPSDKAPVVPGAALVEVAP